MIHLKNQSNSNTDARRKFREWASLFSGKLFVQIVVYADESGTDGIAPCVSGYIASPDYWIKFCEDWSCVLKSYGAPYFHFRELNRSERAKPNNPYHGWSDDHADDFIHDLAMIASREAVPFGGHIKLLKLKASKPLLYQGVFELFFDDFIEAMNEHWPSFKGQVDFFFEENKNEDWITSLNSVIKLQRKKDYRIGTYTFVQWDSERHGIPLQAADMLYPL